MISSITEPETVRRILAHLGLRTEPYGFEPARPVPQAELWTGRRPRGSAQRAPRSQGWVSVSVMEDGPRFRKSGFG